MELLEFINLKNLNNLDLIAKGGPVMIILLGFSVFAFAIIFVKLIQFFSEFSNVKVFKQDKRFFEIPEKYKIAPIEQIDDINELLELMVKRI